MDVLLLLLPGPLAGPPLPELAGAVLLVLEAEGAGVAAGAVGAGSGSTLKLRHMPTDCELISSTV